MPAARIVDATAIDKELSARRLNVMRFGYAFMEQADRHHANDAPSPSQQGWDASRPVRKASLIAGVALLLMSALAGFGYSFAINRLVTAGNAALTARHIMAHEGLFRFGIASLFLVVALDVVVAWGLYRVFRVSKRISALAAWLRVVYAAVGVNSLADAVVHLVLIVIFFAWSSRRLGQAFKLPSTSTLLAILAVILAVIGIVLATRPGRRFAKGTLVPGVRSAAASLSRNPGKMTMLFGGSALITLAYIGAFAASVEAFGGGPGFVVLGAVYLGTATVAAATPTPGGIGGFEAAAIVGLTGVGMANGPAVSAVLLYRLATYWLPVAPGWLAWRVLQRRGYV